MTRLKKAVKWALTTPGRHDIGLAVTSLLTLYVALHRAGAF